MTKDTKAICGYCQGTGTIVIHGLREPDSCTCSCATPFTEYHACPQCQTDWSLLRETGDTIAYKKGVLEL